MNQVLSSLYKHWYFRKMQLTGSCMMHTSKVMGSPITWKSLDGRDWTFLAINVARNVDSHLCSEWVCQSGVVHMEVTDGSLTLAPARVCAQWGQGWLQIQGCISVILDSHVFPWHLSSPWPPSLFHLAGGWPWADLGFLYYREAVLKGWEVFVLPQASVCACICSLALSWAQWS